MVFVEVLQVEVEDIAVEAGTELAVYILKFFVHNGGCLTKSNKVLFRTITANIPMRQRKQRR